MTILADETERLWRKMFERPGGRITRRSKNAGGEDDRKRWVGGKML